MISASSIYLRMISAVKKQIMPLLLPLLFLLSKSQLSLTIESLLINSFPLFIHKLISWPPLLWKTGHKSFLQSTSCLLFTEHDVYNLCSQNLTMCLATNVQLLRSRCWEAFRCTAHPVVDPGCHSAVQGGCACPVLSKRRVSHASYFRWAKWSVHAHTAPLPPEDKGRVCRELTQNLGRSRQSDCPLRWTVCWGDPCPQPHVSGPEGAHSRSEWAFCQTDPITM